MFSHLLQRMGVCLLLEGITANISFMETLRDVVYIDSAASVHFRRNSFRMPMRVVAS